MRYRVNVETMTTLCTGKPEGKPLIRNLAGKSVIRISTVCSQNVLFKF